MIPLNLWERQNAIKALYAKCVETVCETYRMTRMELDILLFLANNPRFDTAAEIVEIRYLSKSQVSASVKRLETRGYIRKTYENQNRKTAHLKLCPKASDTVRDGRAAQEKFLAIMLSGFSQEETRKMKQYFERIQENIHVYLKEEDLPCTNF